MSSADYHYDPALCQLKKAVDLAKETGAPKEVTEAVEKALTLFHQREAFMEATTCAESDTCKKIKTETVTHDWQKATDEKKTIGDMDPVMLSGHLEGQFLKSFLSAQKAKRVLDVGMYTGYSAMSIAEALPDDGQVVTLDVEDYLKELVQSLTEDSPHKNKISIIIGPAIGSMQKMRDDGEQFDAIFLDAVKYEYPDYLKLALEGNLLAPGGTILIDNAFYFGRAYLKPENCSAKFSELIRNKPDLHVVLVPIRDGLYIIRRRVDVDGGIA